MIESGQLLLLKQRRFAPFFWTQFLGAANDSVFKFAVTLLVTYQGPAYTSMSTATAINLIAAVFILPFLLLSATSGQLSDRIDKARLMRAVKWLELGIMLLGVWGFAAKSFGILLLCVFLMGTHSTLFARPSTPTCRSTLDRGKSWGATAWSKWERSSRSCSERWRAAL